MKIFDDNETSFILTKNPKSQNHTKYINMMYYCVRELVDKGVLKIEWILNSLILANSLTKAFLTGLFKKH